MNKNRRLTTTTIITLVIFLVIACHGLYDNFMEPSACLNRHGSVLRCLEISLFPDRYQAVSLFSLALLISLIPLYFTKEAAWRTWRTFAVVYLPIAAIIISVTPTTASLAIGSDPKEIFTLWLSGLFVVISFLIALKKHFEK